MTTPAPARATREGVRQRLAEIGLAAPEACLDGVVHNLGVLQDHMETLRQLPLDDDVTLALDYRA